MLNITGFYSTTNESITVIPEGNNRAVYTRGMDKQARCSMSAMPDKLWVANTVHPDKSKRLKEGEEYFTLQGYLNALIAAQADVKKFAL